MPSAANPASNQKTFTLLLFASAQSYTGESSLTLSAPLSLSQLFPTLEKMYPGITCKVLRSCAVSVNLEYVDVPGLDDDRAEGSGNGDGSNREGGLKDGVGRGEMKGSGEAEVVIQPGDEVGIIPPVSSG